MLTIKDGIQNLKNLLDVLSVWPQVDISLTEDGHNDVVLDDLDGAPRDEVEGDDDVALVHQRVPRGRMRRLELHGQSPESTMQSLALLVQYGWQLLRPKMNRR